MALPRWCQWCTNFCTHPYLLTHGPHISPNLNSWDLPEEPNVDLADFWLIFWQLLLLLGRRTSLSSIPCPPSSLSCHRHTCVFTALAILLRSQKKANCEYVTSGLAASAWVESMHQLDRGRHHSAAAANSLLQLTKLASRAETKPYQTKTIVYYTKSYQAMVWNNLVNYNIQHQLSVTCFTKPYHTRP